ncbi:MAG: flavodoxin family protein [Candidatus Zixiibacteriota bacterium]
MIKLLVVSGSPVVGSSTDILLHEIEGAIVGNLPSDRIESTFVKLNDMKFIPCQACGKAPTPDWCFFHDDLDKVYSLVAECDCLLFGSPIYFDSVSAQAKAFMDRCNCFRPVDFDDTQPNHHFVKRLKRKRPGAIVLVGGANQWMEGARRSIAGFFKWIEVTNEGVVTYATTDDNRIGTVKEDREALNRAQETGKHLASLLAKTHEA